MGRRRVCKNAQALACVRNETEARECRLLEVGFSVPAGRRGGSGKKLQTSRRPGRRPKPRGRASDKSTKQRARVCTGAAAAAQCRCAGALLQLAQAHAVDSEGAASAGAALAAALAAFSASRSSRFFFSRIRNSCSSRTQGARKGRAFVGELLSHEGREVEGRGARHAPLLADQELLQQH